MIYVYTTCFRRDTVIFAHWVWSSFLTTKVEVMERPLPNQSRNGRRREGGIWRACVFYLASHQMGQASKWKSSCAFYSRSCLNRKSFQPPWTSEVCSRNSPPSILQTFWAWENPCGALTFDRKHHLVKNRHLRWDGTNPVATLTWGWTSTLLSSINGIVELRL